jgi:hypothetical protein
VILRLGAVALPVEFAWEMLQAPAFTGMPDSRLASTVVCGLAAIGDGVLVVVTVGLTVLTFGDERWFVPFRCSRIVVSIVYGLALQVLVEWLLARRLGLWGYASWHPTVFGIGVIALLQPIVVLPLIFWIVARWRRARP